MFLRNAVLTAALFTTAACAAAPRKVYVVEGKRYTYPVVVYKAAPPRHLKCWRVARHWHCRR